MVFRWSIITDNQLVGVLNQALKPKNLFPINQTILLSDIGVSFDIVTDMVYVV
jgi:hypothetical protein